MQMRSSLFWDVTQRRWEVTDVAQRRQCLPSDLRCVASQKGEDLPCFKGLEIGEESQGSRDSSRPLKMKLQSSFETMRIEYRVMRRYIPSECPQDYMFPSYISRYQILGGPTTLRRRTFRSLTLKQKAKGVRNPRRVKKPHHVNVPLMFRYIIAARCS